MDKYAQINKVNLAIGNARVRFRCRNGYMKARFERAPDSLLTACQREIARSKPLQPEAFDDSEGRFARPSVSRFKCPVSKPVFKKVVGNGVEGRCGVCGP